MTASLPPLCTELHFPPSGLLSLGQRPTPTDSRASGQKSIASDASVFGESIAPSIPTKSSTQDSVTPLIDSCSDGVWSYMKLSMTNNDTWDWRLDQVKKYIELACLKPESPVSPTAKAHLKCVWREIIEPAFKQKKVYIYVGEDLVCKLVDSPRGLKVPITDFFTAFGWVVTMTESPMSHPTPEKYQKLLCVFSKWCHLLGKQHFGAQSHVPNTAAIAWFKDIVSTTDKSDLEYFCIYTNLATSSSPAKPKEEARRIRKKHLKRRLGKLGIEPKARNPSNVKRNTKFGHCAETLVLTSSMDPHHLRYRLTVLAVTTWRVVNDMTYVPASELNINSTAWKARKRVCENCNQLLGQLRAKSGSGGLNHYDWWEELKIQHEKLKGRAIEPTAAAVKHAIDVVKEEAKKMVYRIPRRHKADSSSECQDECDSSASTTIQEDSDDDEEEEEEEEDEEDNDADDEDDGDFQSPTSEDEDNCVSQDEDHDDDCNQLARTPTPDIIRIADGMQSLKLDVKIHTKANRNGHNLEVTPLNSYYYQTRPTSSCHGLEERERACSPSDSKDKVRNGPCRSDAHNDTHAMYVQQQKNSVTLPSRPNEEQYTFNELTSKVSDESDEGSASYEPSTSEDESDEGSASYEPSTSEEESEGDETTADELSAPEDNSEGEEDLAFYELSTSEEESEGDETAADEPSASEDNSEREEDPAFYEPPTSEVTSDEFEDDTTCAASDLSLAIEEHCADYDGYDSTDSFIVNDGNDDWPGPIEDLRVVARNLGANYRCRAICIHNEG